MPKPEVINRRPDALSYPQTRIKNRQYGKNVQVLVQKPTEAPYPNHQAALASTAFGYMKTIQRSKTNNQDSINEELISEPNASQQRQQKSKHKKKLFLKSSDPKNQTNKQNKNKK